jgi:hypothetical protein
MTSGDTEAILHNTRRAIISYKYLHIRKYVDVAFIAERISVKIKYDVKPRLIVLV